MFRGDKPDFIGRCFVARALHARAGGLGGEASRIDSARRTARC